MQAVKGHLVNGSFTPIDGVALPSHAEVMLIFWGTAAPAAALAPGIEKPKRQLGFLKDKVPPLPDSFFDPLPEEDLLAWGL